MGPDSCFQRTPGLGPLLRASFSPVGDSYSRRYQGCPAAPPLIERRAVLDSTLALVTEPHGRRASEDHAITSKAGEVLWKASASHDDDDTKTGKGGKGGGVPRAH